MILKRQRNIAIVFIMLMMWMPDCVSAREPESEKLSDGVIRWYRIQEEKPWFFKQFEAVFKELIPDENELPFGKSVAFLVGVSNYTNLPKLSFVENDLTALRKYLLDNGGFDEVYVAEDKVATPTLVDNYMRNNRMNLGRKDRLLFYYSGHGADMHGNTGYMQFMNAKHEYEREHYLRIDECLEWSGLPSSPSHILFIFDCCASGLAFAKKSGSDDAPYNRILAALSGKRSLTVITAGTAGQATYGVDKHSVFTKAFLNAMQRTKNKDGFMTISQIYDQIRVEIDEFSQKHAKITPQKWELERDADTGTFLFIDTSARNLKLPEEYRKTLDIPPVPKGQVVNVVGIIELTSYVNGEVYIDGQKVRDITKGQTVEFDKISAEKTHKLEVRGGGKIYSYNISVEKGEKTPITVKEVASSPSIPEPEPPRKTEPASTKPAQPQAQAPKYPLRKEPMTVSEDEFIKVSRLDKETWRPLEYIQNDFKDNGDGTISDDATGLMWQQSGSDNYMKYDDTKAYIEKLNREKFAGYSDWRLPTVDELKSLITKEKQSDDLYINPIFDKTQRWCWTSDKRASGGAWYVGFDFGDVGWNLVSVSYVRAVRLRQ